MTTLRSQLAAVLPQAATFSALVAIGVVGRWGQTEWAVTPLVAVGLMAGYALPHRVALFVPLVAMLVSDIALSSYGSRTVMLAVYGAMLAPVLLGGLLRRPAGSRVAGLARLAGCAVVPAVLFFLSTNFMVWAAQSLYPKTLAGLAECYTAALPFFRSMLAGDVAYTALLFGAAGLAGAFSLTGAAAGNGGRKELATTEA